MRRLTPDVHRADELLGPEAALDPEMVIRVLEPMVLEQRRARLQEVIGRRLMSVTVVLDGPHDPHNGAAVMRSCDAFGVQTLHVIERYEPFLAAKTVAKGTEKWVDVHVHPDTPPLARRLSGFELVATEATGDLRPEDLPGIEKLALIVGNEREGIARDLRALCRRAVRVPMRGFVDSLNLSVSTAILLSSATPGRPGDLPEADRRRLYARGLYLSVPRAAEVLLRS
jgi:tRNA (guanosine-2'-O-)-methyltransferase